MGNFPSLETNLSLTELTDWDSYIRDGSGQLSFQFR